MNNELTISKVIESQYGTSYAALKESGMRYIEQLSGKLWTDYNTHDPGITFLELLCYAITDLGYRISMPMQDIVASPKDNLQSMHKQFHSALEVLPNAPISIDDFRKILVRINGVKNIWLHKHKKSIIATFKPQPIKIKYAKHTDVPKVNEELQFNLNGLYDILIEFDEHAYNNEIPLKDWKEGVMQKVKNVFHRFRSLCEDVEDIKEVPTQEVVLCTDIALKPDADPEKVYAKIAFAVEQYLSPDIRYYTLAEMLAKGKTSDEIFDGPVFDFENILFDEDSEGELIFKKGFIDNEDIINSKLRTQLRLSDIIRIVSKIEGVQYIKNITFAFCGCEETDKSKVAQVFNKDTWLLCIKEGHKPILCLDNTIINFYKDIIPIQLKNEAARAELAALHAQHIKEVTGKYIEDLPMPEGRYRNIDEYTSIQNQLPETYAVGQVSLPDSASITRKAQAKQLKAYLYFFDQILANYFTHLSNVKHLLSVDNDLTNTYFSNVVKDIKGIEEIIIDGKIASDRVISILGLDDYPKRSNQLLNHLLARFNEQFGEYVFLLHRIYGDDFNYASIRHKKNFYKDYNNLSTWRGSGFDYYNNKSEENDSVNISGMEKRISRLLGFNHYKMQPLAGLPYNIYRLQPANSRSLFTWQIKKDGNNVLIGSGTAIAQDLAYEELGLATIIGIEDGAYGALFNHNVSTLNIAIIDSNHQLIACSVFQDNTTDFGSIVEAFHNSNNLRTILLNAIAANIRYKLSNDKKKVTFDFVKDDIVIATCPSWFAVMSGELESENYSQAQYVVTQILSQDEALLHYLVDFKSQKYKIQIKGNQGQLLLVSVNSFSLQKGVYNDENLFDAFNTHKKELQNYLEQQFRLEGMYVVEHILLRPDDDNATTDEFMPLCIDLNGNYCKPLDPYSFRIDVVLPGYSLRLRNKYFRQFAENIIRMETPAHILPRICFVDEKQMQQFEAAYFEWRIAKRTAAQENKPINKVVIKKFMDILENLFTIYEQGYLSDCDDDTQETNPIILGSTFLGTLNSSEQD